MKKLIFLIFIISVVFLPRTICADSCNGYLFRLEENKPVLFSDNSITHLGDGLYVAQTEEEIYKFTSKDNVVTVFPNYTLELFEMDYPYTTNDSLISAQWPLDTIAACSAREKGVFGNGVKIGIIDSGLNVNHPDLDKSRIVDAYNCIEGVSDTSNVSDSVGHGTHVAGTIAAQTDNGLCVAGIAPGAYICPIKITDSKSFGLSSFYLGIKKAIELKCDIINLSLGGKISNQSAINEMTSWIKKAQDAGIIVVAAAGNYGETELCYPAACDGVIGVGAMNKQGNLWSKSERNSSVFVTAPGELIYSLSASGGVSIKSGTSMATPHVVATVALIRELCPEGDIGYIKNILKETSVDHGDTGYDTSFGHGVINIENILKKLDEYIPDMVISEGITNSVKRIHIHNNGKSRSFMGCFASYSDNTLSAFKKLEFNEIPEGVTNINWETGLEVFYFWDEELRPYCQSR